MSTCLCQPGHCVLSDGKIAIRCCKQRWANAMNALFYRLSISDEHQKEIGDAFFERVHKGTGSFPAILGPLKRINE